MQMQIGVFRFELGREFSRPAWAWRRRWAQRERRGRPAALEDLGRDATTIRLRGTITIEVGDDMDALAPLRVEAGMVDSEQAPTPLPAYLGGTPGASGEYIGEWVISRITERHRDLRTGAGIPTRIEFEIQMTEAVA